MIDLIAALGPLCPLLGVLLAAAVLRGCEGRMGEQRLREVHLDPPNPPMVAGSPNPTTEVTK